MKKIIALVLAMVMCFSLLAACGGKDDAGTANTGSANTGSAGTTNTGSAGTTNTEPPKADVKYKDTIKISAQSEIEGIELFGATGAQTTYTGRLTHQSLTKWNYETGTADYELADKIEDVNGDGKTWKVTLKKGVMFHDNEKDYCELKAGDIKYTYEFADPEGFGVEAGVCIRTNANMKYVDEIEVTGDYECIFHLNTAFYDWDAQLGLFILSEKAMTEFGMREGQYYGTGPYFINLDESHKGQYWTITRYEDYWGDINNHPTKNIVFVIHPDHNTGVAALQAGEVDVLIGVNATSQLQFAGNDDYQTLSVAGTSLPSLFFNSYDGWGAFDGEDTPEQIKLRQAIKLALDKDAICAVIYATNPAAGGRRDSLWHPSNDGFVDCGQSEFNVEKAQAIMKELGYGDNNRMKLKLAHYASYTDYAQIIQDLLKKIYIDVEVVTLDTSVFGQTLRTGQGWDLCVNYYATGMTITSVMTSYLHSTSNNAKVYGWNSAEMDKRIDEVMNQPSAAAQREAFAEFQKWANDYNPRIPTHGGNVTHVTKAGVEGYTVCPNNTHQEFGTIRFPEK